MGMRLERTVWPVGHGAFYTEQFKDENNHVLFTAVYDCGSEQEDALKKCIKELLPEKRQLVIDALFISHFHSDHVNGLEYLLGKNVLVKKLFIPQLTDNYVINVLAEEFGDGGNRLHIDTLNFLRRLYNGETIANVEEILEVPVIEGENIPGEEYRPDETIINRKHAVSPVVVEKKINDVPFWVYIPYNHYKNNNLDQVFIKYGYGNNNVVDVNHIFEDLINGNWKYIQEVFSEIYDDKHNEYSMTVYSGADVNASFDTIVADLLFNFSYIWYHPHGGIMIDEQQLGCLYTGDFEAKKYTNMLIGFYSKMHDAWDRTYLLQVPHHGSYKNYEEHLYNNHRKLTFISSAINDSYGHPHVQTLVDVSNKDCPIVIVQDNKATVLRIDYNIEY